jgi:fructokinase
MLPEGPALGGAPLNLAYRLSELGEEALIVSAVGRDQLGDRALERMQQLGLSTALVQRVPDLPTGTVNIDFGPDGEPAYEIVAPVAYDSIRFQDGWSSLFGAVDCICFGTLAQRNAVSRGTLARVLATTQARTRFCDVNLRPDCYNAETVIASIDSATIVKLNGDELRDVSAMIGLDPDADRTRLMSGFLDRFPGLNAVVVTLGSDGATGLERGGNAASASVPPVTVVDPCGAGDAFSAAFLATYLSGASLVAAIVAGNLRGSRVAGLRGATDPISETSTHTGGRHD